MTVHKLDLIKLTT